MKQLTLNMKVRRDPWTPVPADPPTMLRQQLLDQMEKHVTVQARAPEVMLFFGDDWVDVASLGDTRPPEAEELLAGALVAAGRRDGVQRAFRMGELRLRGPDGQPCRAACVLELRIGGAIAAAPRWWFAHRFVQVTPDQIGTMDGAWVESVGVGADALDEGARHWLDTTPEQVESIKIGKTPLPPPEPVVQASVHDLAEELPADAKGVATLAGELARQDLEAGSIEGIVVLAFHQRDVERWEIRGEMTYSVDDLVRAIAAYSSAVAVALVQPAVMEVGEGPGEGEEAETHRTLTALAERDGHRYVHVRTLNVTPEGVTDAGLVIVTDCGEPGADGWIGVPPSRPIRVDPLGGTPGPGGVVPEA